MRLRVMTYNIHKGIGGIDRRYDPDRIVATVSHYAPDLLLLQEVDDGVPRSRQHRQVDLLGEALDFPHRVFQPNVQLRQGAYGNAILSRFPVREHWDIELTIRPKKRRRAQVTKLRLPLGDTDHVASRTLVLVNLHLGLAAFERRMQLRKLLADPGLAGIHADTPTIMGGDFNDVWQNLGVRLLQNHSFQSALGHTKTFPAAYPLRCLDGLYFRGNVRLDHAFAGQTELVRQASDHLPGIADFELTSTPP
ncbi:MAG: endonuclease/exonuclease/phosphatase family protein [Planctomycetales bacterium]|nr:endonuclease/exonuclease/phosphatase family protein [Planctomycetales bacterium]